MPTEQWKVDIAKEFIKEKVLNKDLVEIQENLNLLQNEIQSGNIFNFKKIILGSEGKNNNETKNDNKIFGLDGIMNILFNEKGEQRSELGYNLKKFKSNYFGILALISDEGKENLDLLYEGLKKAKTEEELRNNLKNDLSKLENDVQNNINIQNNLSDLTPEENKEMENLVEQSKNTNNINYLENPTYKKYLNIIECDLNLPKYTLECVCMQESGGKLYKNGRIIGSSAGAQGLFQFMPGTSNQYMKHSKLNEKYGKIFSSKNKFLKDPLASAWAAGIMYSEFMNKYQYNLQTSLACYNWGIGNYQNKIGKRNLTQGDMDKLREETRKYVNNITKNIMEHNSISSDNIFIDLGGYKRNNNINT